LARYLIKYFKIGKSLNPEDESAESELKHLKKDL